MKLERFFEKFEQFADAPNAVAKMRELVRHLAITGKLVPQDPKDEPAIALLSKIATHKAELSKVGKLRGQTTVIPMAPEDGVFEIPASWTWVRFGEVMVNRDGERIPVSKEERTNKAKSYDYYGASGVIDKIDCYLFDKPLLLIGEDGANLISRSTPIAFMARGQYWVNNHAHVLDGISEDFLRYIELHINAISLEPYVTGSAQPKMNQAKMNSIPIALPPLAEQKRIVAKVDELMALCDRLEAQQQERDIRHAALARASLARFAEAPTPANLDFLFQQTYTIPPADLRKSILTLAVQGKLVPQDPNDESAENLHIRIHEVKERLIKEKAIKRVTVEQNPGDSECEILPTGWMWTRLGNVFDVRDGTHDTPKYTSEGFPLITSKNIYSGSLSFEGVSLISEEDHRKICERSRVERGDILFAMIGSIGNPVIVDTDMEFSIKNVALFKYYAHADSEPRFLLHYLKLVSEEIKEKASGAVQSFVSLGFLRNYPFPLPPLVEQRRIVAKVDQLLALVDQLEAQLTTSGSSAEKLMEAVVAELTMQS
jgi:type I restriction enzyme S subunit